MILIFADAMAILKPILAAEIALGVVLAGAWLLLAALLGNIVREGPAQGGEGRYSRGWELLWAYLLASIYWLVLGLLLYLLAARGGLWVFLLGSSATVGGFRMLGEGQRPRWAGASAAAIVLVMSALVSAAALSGQWDALRLPVLAIAAVFCLVAATWTVFDRAGHRRQQVAQWELDRWRLAQLEKRCQDMVGINQRIIQNIGEDQALRNLIPLLDGNSGVADEALAAFKKLHRRQNDVEEMLADPQRENLAMQLVPQLDLALTPHLQQLVNAWCLHAAQRTRPGSDDESGSFIFFALPALHWLHEHGGDCKEGLSHLKSAATNGLGSTHRDAADRQRLLKELDEMLK